MPNAVYNRVGASGALNPFYDAPIASCWISQKTVPKHNACRIGKIVFCLYEPPNHALALQIRLCWRGQLEPVFPDPAVKFFRGDRRGDKNLIDQRVLPQVVCNCFCCSVALGDLRVAERDKHIQPGTIGERGEAGIVPDGQGLGVRADRDPGRQEQHQPDQTQNSQGNPRHCDTNLI